jgi:cation transport regulator
MAFSGHIGTGRDLIGDGHGIFLAAGGTGRLLWINWREPVVVLLLCRTFCLLEQRGGSCLPYASVEDLPSPIHAHLPLHGQEIYRSAFNNAWTEYAARGPVRRETTAHRVAWAAVKRRYQKSGDRWVAREPY